jgi:hypothetical protein
MPKNITTEGINELIEKINGKLTSGLTGAKAKMLLAEIEGDLEEIEENAEAKHKTIVNKKAEELKGIISGNFSGELSKTQDALNGVKSGLEELKEEIKKLEESENTLMKPQVGSRRSNPSTSLVEVSEQTRGVAQEYVNLGKGALPVLGDLVGAGLGATHGFAILGAKFAEDAMNSAVDVGLDAVHVGADVYKDTTRIVAGGIENFRGGAEKLTGQSITEGADITKKVIKNFDGLGTVTDVTKTLTDGIGGTQKVKAEADRDARIAEANAKVEIAKAQTQAEMYKAQVELAKLGIKK